MNLGRITFYRSFDEAVQDLTGQPNHGPPGVASDDDHLLRAADYPATPVDWLWPGRIPIGKVTLLVGDPGLGKSLLAIDIAARVTRNARWPDHQEGARSGKHGAKPRHSMPGAPGSVLILSAEDDLADTIRPRLDAAGANPYRVYFLSAIADLRHDMQRLRDAVDRVRHCRLIVVDPLNAYVGPSDSHFHTVMRRVLRPLTDLARDKGLAVLAIAHVRKSHGPALHRTAGSLAFVAASRALWTVVRDPADRSRHLFLPLKHNLAPATCGLAFRIESRPTRPPLPPGEGRGEGASTPGEAAPVPGANPVALSELGLARSEAPESSSPPTVPWIAWDPDPLTAPPEELLAPPPRPRPPSPERAAAHAFLQNLLADGPRPAEQVIDEGEERGFHCRTLRRALRDIGGRVEKRGLLGSWWWSLSGFDTLETTKLNSTDGRHTPKTHVPLEGDKPETTNGATLPSQPDPDFQQISFDELAKSIRRIDPRRLERARAKISRRQANRDERRPTSKAADRVPKTRPPPLRPTPPTPVQGLAPTS